MRLLGSSPTLGVICNGTGCLLGLTGLQRLGRQLAHTLRNWVGIPSAGNSSGVIGSQSSSPARVASILFLVTRGET